MAKKDALEKVLFSYNDMFYQCWNCLGEHRYHLDPDLLVDVPTEGILLAEPHPIQGFRDIMKLYKDETNFQLIYLGLENQTLMDRFMSIRLFNYAGQSYEQQRRQGDRISPVITRVLYFGYEKRWDGPRSLRELIGHIPEEAEAEFVDFPFTVIELAWLTDEEIQGLSNDLRILALFLRGLRLKQMPEWGKDVLRHALELLELIKAISKIDLTDNYAFETEPEGGLRMCEFFESWKKDLVDKAVAAKELEVQIARSDAQIARSDAQNAVSKMQIAINDAQIARSDAQIARSDAQNAVSKMQIAINDAQIARNDAQIARSDAQIARSDALYAQTTLTNSIANMFQHGLNADRIQQLTGLPMETIQQVAQQM